MPYNVIMIGYQCFYSDDFRLFMCKFYIDH